MRFSELVNLRPIDVLFESDKTTLKILRSKTDTGGKGQKVVFDADSFPSKFTARLRPMHGYLQN